MSKVYVLKVQQHWISCRRPLSSIWS